MLFCVFGFNRGLFLEHCVRTIEVCAPMASIAIFDDDSNDPATISVLERLAKSYPVVQPGGGQQHKLGGLYSNMQAALEFAKNERMVCFLQDDMQLVRALSHADIDHFEQLFAASPGLAFLQPCFLKGVNRTRDLEYLHFDDQRGIYQRHLSNDSAGHYFAAVSIACPSRLLEKGWVFGASEPENDRQARRHFEQLAHLFLPFAMWLPDVPAYRGKRKTLALRIAERQRACGFYPYEQLTVEEVYLLKSRSPATLPVAEDFLRCSNADLLTPWGYYPLQGAGWLKKLSSFELAVRRFFV